MPPNAKSKLFDRKHSTHTQSAQKSQAERAHLPLSLSAGCLAGNAFVSLQVISSARQCLLSSRGHLRRASICSRRFTHFHNGSVHHRVSFANHQPVWVFKVQLLSKHGKGPDQSCQSRLHFPY